MEKNYNPEKESLNSYINRTKNKDLSMFLVGLEKFPFYNEVINKVTQLKPEYNSLSTNEQSLLFVKTMLEENMLKKLNGAAL